MIVGSTFRMGLAEDRIYLAILLVSFLFSVFVKLHVKAKYRDIAGGAFGVALIVSICGWQILYSLILLMGNLVILKKFKWRYIHVVSFVYTFAYLTFTRCAHLVGLPKLLPHANAVQLIMTLRCIGLAFEIHDSVKESVGEKDADDQPKSGNRTIEIPTLKQRILYSYNFAGLFTGPYFSYQVHSDMVRCTYLPQISIAEELLPRLSIVPFYIVAFVGLDNLFPLEYMTSDQFSSLCIITRFMYMCPVFLTLRIRFYIAWLLTESICFTNGIGAYPAKLKQKCGWGPLDKEEYSDLVVEDPDSEKFSFETVRNIDPYGCEFSYSFRESMRCWNKSVQFWLSNIVYKRCPKPYRTGITMFVSAFWHGVHPGYYMSFLTIPLCTHAEDVFFRSFNPDGSNKRLKIGWWWLTRRGLEQMSIGFLLLTWSDTLNYWNSIYWFIHLTTILAASAAVFKNILAKKTKKHE